MALPCQNSGAPFLGRCLGNEAELPPTSDIYITIWLTLISDAILLKR